MSERIPYYSTQELCNAIYAAVARSQEQMTRREIAAAIGRKKSPHIVAMIEHLTNSGYFEKIAGADKSGRPTLFYKAAAALEPSAC